MVTAHFVADPTLKALCGTRSGGRTYNPHQVDCDDCARILFSAQQSRASKARWAKKTPEERSAHARMMVQAREQKRAQNRSQ